MRRHEHFRITKYARTYDRREDKFTINIAYETATEITPRTIRVAEAFRVGIDQTQQFRIYDNVELKIGPTDIVYISGDSGSGKSVLLKAIKQDLGEEAVDMADIHPDPDKPLIDTVGKNLSESLELLSRAGLNDAFLFIRRSRELSDGQKYRYKTAKLMESGKQWWIADEFCSMLDRDTAKIVSFNLQKIAEQPPPKETLRVAETLKKLGFDVQLLGSRNYVLKKLQLMRAKHLTLLRQAFIEHNHQRFRKEFSPHQPYGKFKKYKAGVEKADLEKLAKLIKICGMLLQTKVYLLWKKQQA